MRVSHKWLLELVDLPKETTPAVIAERLTAAGLEVEAIEDRSVGLGGVVVGVVMRCEPHPQADRLRVCSVDAGPVVGVVQVVCGAANVAVDARVCLATVGTVLPGGKQIQAAELRGVASQGMLCSAQELGIESAEAGLLLLGDEFSGAAPGGKELPTGTPIAEALHHDDVVYVLGITPNRPDALSHLGVARELAAAFKTRLRAASPTCAERGGPVDDLVTVLIDDAEGCTRYATRVVEGVVVGPSPRWLQSRLAAVGIRSINNVVDVTNLVMMERGIPLHAFDYDRITRIKNRVAIVVRRARAGEVFRTLDGKERTLVEDDLVIADGPVEGKVDGGLKSTAEILVTQPGRAIALAGVMGGAETEVSASTVRILLEAAHFSPGRVRKTARRLDLHSEASHRFERGTDPNGVVQSLDRAAALIADVSSGKEPARVARGIADAYPKRVAAAVVSIRPKRAAQVLGVAAKVVDEASISKMLLSLGLEVDGRDAESMRFRVPTFRPDLTREIDLIEELMRLLGTDAIPLTLPTRAGEAPAQYDARRAQAGATARQALLAVGYDEAVNLAFQSSTSLAWFDGGDESMRLRLKNPLGDERAVMRTSLLPGLLHNLATNLRRSTTDVRLCEQGVVFLGRSPTGDVPGTTIEGARGGDGYAIERERLAWVATGAREPVSLGSRAAPIDFLDGKGHVEEVLAAVGLVNDWRRGDVRFKAAPTRCGFHPRNATEIWWHPAGRLPVLLGCCGELHPDIAATIGSSTLVFVAELELAGLAEALAPSIKVTPLPRFPAVHRDVALVVDRGLPAGELAAALAQVPSAGAWLESVEVFDVYTGPPLAADKKSVAIGMVFRHPDRTLGEADLVQVTTAMLAEVLSLFGAEVRSNPPT